MPTKFYLHAATTAVAGTLPSSSVSGTAPTQTASATNRTFDTSIGTGQTSVTLTTLAQTTTQNGVICRFISPPLEAQTLSSQVISMSGAFSESNASSDFIPNWVLAVWRPSTGALVGRMVDRTGVAWAEPGTTQTAGTSNAAGGVTVTAQTAQQGDVLVIELWRAPGTQGMAVAYTNIAFFDGTTEASTTNCATFIQFTNDVALYVPPPPKDYRVVGDGRGRGPSKTAAHGAARMRAAQ